MITKVSGVRIAGVASAVPSRVMTPSETAITAGVSDDEAQRIAVMTGVFRRHVADPSLCMSDMAFQAATKLMSDLAWDPKSVDTLVVVSQTHDYDLPATACCLQERLGLPTSCAAFDMCLGCSGYVYGLWVCSTLVAAGSARRVLFVAGDTGSWTPSPYDRSIAFLFGDAGTVTALERDENAPPMNFVLGTDGSGKDFIIQPGSGYRNRITAETIERRPAADGTLRGPLDVYMDGAEVFAFTLRQVPPLMKETLRASGWTLDTMDAFVPHQANLFMLQHLVKRLKVPTEKAILCLDEFGNTSSASIPLALNHKLATQLREGSLNLIMAGFGVGWSWGSVAVTCGPMVMPEILYLEVPEPVAVSS